MQEPQLYCAPCRKRKPESAFGFFSSGKRKKACRACLKPEKTTSMDMNFFYTDISISNISIDTAEDLFTCSKCYRAKPASGFYTRLEDGERRKLCKDCSPNFVAPELISWAEFSQEVESWRLIVCQYPIFLSSCAKHSLTYTYIYI